MNLFIQVSHPGRRVGERWVENGSREANGRCLTQGTCAGSPQNQKQWERCIHMYTYMHTYTQTYACVHRCIHIYTCKYTDTYAYMNTYLYKETFWGIGLHGCGGCLPPCLLGRSASRNCQALVLSLGMLPVRETLVLLLRPSSWLEAACPHYQDKSPLLKLSGF